MTDFRAIDLTVLEYKEPRANPQTGGKSVFVSTVAGSNDPQHKLRFQMSEDQNTNLQTAVFGLSSPLPGQVEDRRRSLELSIESADLADFLTRLDNKNIDIATANSEAWFKKPMDRATVENMYISLVRQPTSAEYRPMVRTKVKINERTNTNVWVVSKSQGAALEYTRGTYHDITKGGKVMAMVETNGLWFASRQFGMSLAVSDIMVWPNATAPFFKFASNTTASEIKASAEATGYADDFVMQ